MIRSILLQAVISHTIKMEATRIRRGTKQMTNKWRGNNLSLSKNICPDKVEVYSTRWTEDFSLPVTGHHHHELSREWNREVNREGGNEVERGWNLIKCRPKHDTPIVWQTEQFCVEDICYLQNLLFKLWFQLQLIRIKVHRVHYFPPSMFRDCNYRIMI